ncbi:MAG TPA: phosphate signaling complex protein PhoU [Hyphomicrobiaceae bacterium]|nr:phosphate signaling complex protein PhoU [Hyphomicrobiaceae bacterium]
MRSEHIVRSFDDELQQIENLVTKMGGMVELQISNATISLVERDIDLGEQVRADDKKIDALEAEIDTAVVRVLALRQPAAQDLRAVVAVLKISTNLERIGDYAKNIAKRSSVIGEFRHIGASANIIKRMSALVQVMLKDALDAHVSRNVALADDVRMRDDEVDQMHNTLFRELLTYMMEDARNITPCMHLLFIAKNVERMGDHVTGIAEQIHYVVSGSLPGDERPKSDVTSLIAITPNDGDRADDDSNDGSRE